MRDCNRTMLLGSILESTLLNKTETEIIKTEFVVVGEKIKVEEILIRCCGLSIGEKV